MDQAIALIDGNNFYAACEQSIDPSVVGRPIVVLSNNDGCIVARSPEARKLGIKMGQPYFKIRHKLDALDVIVRSSNYELYGDISRRLMSLLNSQCERMEIYSIDEAFLLLDRPGNNELYPWARELRSKAIQWLGLPITIGIGNNKSQAKSANYLAKVTPSHAGIFDLSIQTEYDNWLNRIPIEEVWGIGKTLSKWCRSKGVTNARQLRDMPSSALSSKYGIKGIRLQQELKGEKCIPLTSQFQTPKQVCVSRSFGRPITTLEELNQAISTYVVRASEKLREQKQYANTITIFITTSPFKPFSHEEKASMRLQIASNDTGELIGMATSLIKKIFHPNYSFVKAGVILQNLQSSEHIQNNLLPSHNIEKQQKRERLMQTIDQLNKNCGKGTIGWAACGIKRDWKARCEQLSHFSTTRIRDIPVVKA